MNRQYDVLRREPEACGEPVKVGTVTAESLTHANKKATLLFGWGCWAREKSYA